MADNLGEGISIDRISIKKADFETAQQYEVATQSHRDEGHTFHIVQKGTVVIEVDFQQYTIAAPTVVYMHPNQVHRILEFIDVTVCSLSITNEHVNPVYLTFLEEIAPAKPLALTKESYTNIFDTCALCLHLSTQKSNRLYHLVLKDSCNILVALVTSAFLNQQKSSGNLSRFELIAKSFKSLLDKNYCTIKRPAEYAKRLHISTPYLNESIKNATGLPVSQHIRDRIILEAKRMLYHTNKSVKEIALDLGYEDYPYFSRVFTKAAGMSALAFRNKNNE